MWRRQRKSEAPAATLTLTGRPDRPTEQQDGSWGAGPAHPFPPGPSEGRRGVPVAPLASAPSDPHNGLVKADASGGSGRVYALG